jgi:hypothetical protein
MRSFACALVLCAAIGTARADNIVASGPVKAYRGPEGEVVAMLEISDGKEMLVYFRNLDITLDGRTLRYAIADTGHGDKEVYIVKKRGSKTYHSIMLVSRDRRWTFTHPTKHEVTFDLRYSEEWSGKIKAEDIIKALSP